MNVLVVDDESSGNRVQQLLEISYSNIRVAKAVTVDLGIRNYSRDDYDVVLLKYPLPNYHDSLSMVHAMRVNPKGRYTAIIIMINTDDEGLAVRCLQEGAHDILPCNEITAKKLRRVIINAQTRNRMERELQKNYEMVKKQAESDALTGLANRYVFDKSLQVAIDLSKKDSRKKTALLMIDVDNFKNINDTYGHSIGDHVLQSIVQRTRGCLRGSEVFVRLGGDEFAIIVANLTSANQVSQVASRVRETMLNPFNFKDYKFHLTISIGISLYPDNGMSCDELIENADVAMYRSKKLGKNRICFYQEDMQVKFYDRYCLEQALRQAVEKKQLLLHYQPCFNNFNYEIDSVEALIRWDHPEFGIMYPGQFLSIAEENLHILNIGRWVLEEAITQLSIWNQEYNQKLSITINLSPLQLIDNMLIETVKSLCDKYSVSPELIQFELTETFLMEETEEFLNNLKKISNLGCHLTLDDFGSGYSSISHLRNFPIDSVKIDTSLIPNKTAKEQDDALVSGLVLMVHELGLTAIVEGVETQEYANYCQTLGVDKVQGYFFSKSFESAQMGQYLSNNHHL